MTELRTIAVPLIPIAALLAHHLRVRPRKVPASAIETGRHTTAPIAGMRAAPTVMPGTAPPAVQLLARVCRLAAAGLLSPIMARGLAQRLRVLDAAHNANHQG